MKKQILHKLPGIFLYDFYEEAKLWEEEKDLEVLGRIHFLRKSHRRPFDPTKERIRNWRRRHRGSKYSYSKEEPSVKKAYQRHFRQLMKQHLYNEAYDGIRARYYKSYGWLSW